MIDIENALFTAVATVLRKKVKGIFVSGEYVAQPSQFPAVSIVEMINTTLRSTQDSGSMENAVEVLYQVDVYSNRYGARKSECKSIIAEVDAQFLRFGFTRTFLNPVPNMNDATIYRMTASYRAAVSKDAVIYRR